MFCEHCGALIQEGGNFCGGCGNRVRREAAPPVQNAPPVQPAQPVQQAPPVPSTNPAGSLPPAAAAHSSSWKCSWCGAIVEGSQPNCPKCGAAANAAAVTAHSGWAQLPGRKDMAKLQFGSSSCQIEGLYVPAADMNLAAGDSVYFTHHVLLWKDPQVTITTMPMKGAWKRLFAGMPLIMTQAQGPGHIAFSKDDPGEMIPIPLQAGQEIDVREHLFLAATSNIAYDWFQTGIYFQTRSGDDTETHYPVGCFMDRFVAPQNPGLLLLHAGGNIFIRDLAPGQTILVKPTALIFKDPSVQMELHFERPSSMFSGWGSWSNRYLWLRLYGPGRVAIQSVFERLEGESGNITGYSYATEQRW